MNPDDPTQGDAPEVDPNLEMAQLFFSQIVDLYNSGTRVMVVDYEKKDGEKGKIKVTIATEGVTGNHPLTDDQKARIGELVGEATMQWNPKPTGVFESEKASSIVEQIITVAENA